MAEVPHPYDARRAVALPDSLLASEQGWIVWLDALAGLPAWVCAEGHLHPLEARYCTVHGNERPPPHRVWHELALDGVRPRVVHRGLDLAARSDGGSQPALAGNVLAYLTETGRLVAVDLLGDGVLFLAEGVQQAALRVHRGELRGALRSSAGVRHLAWDVRDIRDALRDGSRVEASPCTEAPNALVGLPRGRGKLHVGAGAVRLVVDHDPVADDLAARYKRVYGLPPGPWLIHVVANPEGPPVPFPALRPHTLHQVPVPVPGGVLLIGQLAWHGAILRGAILVPTVGAADVGV